MFENDEDSYYLKTHPKKIYLPHNIPSLPTVQQAEAFWITQQGRWDCWLAALKMALRFWSYDFDYKQMLSQLLGTSLRISEDHGGFFPYTAIITSRLGFNGWLKCPLKHLPELMQFLYSDEDFQKVQPESSLLREIASQCRSNNSARSYLYEALALILETSFTERYTIFKSPSRFSFQDILYFLKLEIPVVVNLPSADFYKVPNDNTNHVLAFIPVSDCETGYIILDPYRERGYKFYSEWQKYLDASKNYNWLYWSDWLLAITPPMPI